METKLEKAKDIIEKYWQVARFGIFNTRNIVGDEMKIIFEEEGLTILICYEFGYFEVFGLSDEEFDRLEKYYERIRYR